MQVLNEGLADTKYRPCPLLVNMLKPVGSRKTQRGFTTIAVTRRC